MIHRYLYKIVHYIIRYGTNKTESKESSSNRSRSESQEGKSDRNTFTSGKWTRCNEERNSISKFIRGLVSKVCVCCFQSEQRKTSTKDTRRIRLGYFVKVTNPFFIFYHKTKTTLQIILLIDMLDSHPSFAIPLLKMIWHTWRDAEVTTYKTINNNGDIE